VTPADLHRSQIESSDSPSARAPVVRASYVPTPLPSGTLAAAASDATPPPARPVSPRVLLIAASVAFVCILVLGLGGLRWRAGSSPEEATRAPAARQQDGSPATEAAAADLPNAAEIPAGNTSLTPPAEPAAEAPETTAAPQSSAKAAGSARPASSAVPQPGKGKKKQDWGY